MAEITLRAFPSKSTPTPTYVASYFVVRCMINSLSVHFGFTLPALYNTTQLVTIHIVTCSFSQLVTINIKVNNDRRSKFSNLSNWKEEA